MSPNKKYYDPVKAFEAARSQKGTAAEKWDAELKLRARASRQPSVAMIWSYKYPGAGMFYLRRPGAGMVMIAIFVVGFILTIAVSPDLLRGFLYCLGFIFAYSIATAIYTFFAAKQDRQEAIDELAKFEAENRPPNE